MHPIQTAIDATSCLVKVRNVQVFDMTTDSIHCIFFIYQHSSQDYDTYKNFPVGRRLVYKPGSFFFILANSVYKCNNNFVTFLQIIC